MFHKNIFIISSGAEYFQEEVRLAQYGLYYLSGGGLDVDCCVGCPWYLAPERLIRTSGRYAMATRAGDVWAFGIAALEMSVVSFLRHFLLH